MRTYGLFIIEADIRATKFGHLKRDLKTTTWREIFFGDNYNNSLWTTDKVTKILELEGYLIPEQKNEKGKVFRWEETRKVGRRMLYEIIEEVLANYDPEDPRLKT